MHQGQRGVRATSPDRRLLAGTMRGGDIHPAGSADTSQETDPASGFLETSMRRAMLNLTVEREFLQRLLATGRAFDLERGGLYDARSGLVNLWASPDDKPACWDRPITRGGLRHPREYVGALAWDWHDDDQAELYVEAAPYALLERRREPLPEQSWRELLDWLREKALGLVRLSQLEPRVLGTRCPFCDFILPAGQPLNGLLEHVAAAHPEVRVQAVTLADPPVLSTDRGDYPLRHAERFD
jgi:hypothetical protein